MNPTDSEDRELMNALRETADDVIPAAAEMRLRKRLEAFRPSINERAEASSIGSSWFGPILKPRIAGLSALATAAVVVVTLLFVYVGDQRTGVAFGDVLKQLRSARTVVYKFAVEVEMAGMPGATRPMTVVTHHIMYREPGLMRMTMWPGPASPAGDLLSEQVKQMASVVTIIDSQRGEMVSLIQASKQAIRTTFNPLDAASADSPIVALDRLRNLRSGSEREVGRKEVDGRPAEGFRLHEDGLVWTVWADPETSFPLLVEIEGKVGGQELKAVMSEFRFDEALDPSLFSLEAPEDFTEFENPGGIDAPEPNEEALSEEELKQLNAGQDPP